MSDSYAVEVKRSASPHEFARDISSSPIRVSLSPVASSSVNQSPGTLVGNPSNPLRATQKHHLGESPSPRSARTKRSKMKTAFDDAQKMMLLTCATRSIDLSEQLAKFGLNLEGLRNAKLVIVSDHTLAHGAHDPSRQNSWLAVQRLDRLTADMVQHMENLQLSMAATLQLVEQWKDFGTEKVAGAEGGGEMTADDRGQREQDGPGYDADVDDDEAYEEYGYGWVV
ncbi:hypothetical protein MBLNU459_g0551t1 [Dothideomycetes sp. NU459]